MSKLANRAAPQRDQDTPEGRKNRVTDRPEQIVPHVQTRSLRGTFAKSICSAHDLATDSDRAACDDGVPCSKLPECMDQADAAIRYLDLRK
ncbi:MAG: hypothetical protein JKY27_03830 [Magnetovibrio sp.]|nr:hypothetical protein [Magnetovibrio sp.]